MPVPVNLTVDPESKYLYVLYDDGSVDAIRAVRDPHHPDPEWQQVAPPNPKATTPDPAELADSLSER